MMVWGFRKKEKKIGFGVYDGLGFGVFSQKSCKTKQPMFVAAKIQYSPIQNQFNPLNTVKKSIRKFPRVSFPSKKLNSLTIPLVLLGNL